LTRGGKIVEADKHSSILQGVVLSREIMFAPTFPLITVTCELIKRELVRWLLPHGDKLLGVVAKLVSMQPINKNLFHTGR